MAEKKTKQKSWAYKVFVENIGIKLFALVLAFFVTLIMNLK